MSPYRILGLDYDGNRMVLSAMFSLNKETNEKNIFILQKPYIDVGDDATASDVAHRMSTRSNSVMLDRYKVYKNDDGRTYQLVRAETRTEDTVFAFMPVIEDHLKTIFNGMVSAMEDYCSRNGIMIQRLL